VRSVHPAADPLSVLRPPPEHTLLLRACLLDAAAGRAAWEEWRARVGGVKAFFSAETFGLKRLLPLLGAALQRAGATLEPELRAYLHVAQTHEMLRRQHFDRIAGAALDALVAGSVACIALQGVALAADAYPAWALRHSHDVDVLVRREDLARAAALLGAIGVGPPTALDRAGRHLRLVHAAALPIVLHSEPFRLPCFAPPLSALWTRSRPAARAGVGGLAAADALLHVCGQAACSPGRDSLQWACDASFLLARHPDLDWDGLIETARAARLALPLSVLLGYLADELAAPARDRLCAAAADADSVTVECALLGAHAAPRVRYRDLLRAGRTWPMRAFVARWIALPSPASLRAAGLVESAAELPGFYARRALRFAARMVSPRRTTGRAPRA